MSSKFLVAVLTAAVLSPELPLEAAPLVVRRSEVVDCGAYRRPVLRRSRLANGRYIDRVVCVGRTRTVLVRTHRSWKKSAAVIGGSTAAGAGVGALVGGKKGALIGGIAGGAAGTAYEVHKRHKRHRVRVPVR